MAPANEFTNPVGVEEAARPNPPRGDEEVSTPPAALEGRSGEERGRAAVIEGEHRAGTIVHESHPDTRALQSVEMSFEGVRRQLVARRHRPREAATVNVRCGRDVVVDQRRDHGRASLTA